MQDGAAASGMGRARAAREGAKVAAVDIDEGGSAAGGEAAAIAADLTSDDKAPRIVSAAVDA